MPNLGQLPEGHENTTRRRRDSEASSTVDVRRRRHSEDSNSSRLRVRSKHGSLQRRAGSLAKHSDPSLLSVLSGLTQPSTASESNTTVTERSHRDERRRKEKSTKGSRVQHRKRVATPSVADTGTTQSDVFEFLNEEMSGQGAQGDAESVLQASSPSVASSTYSRADDDESSDASEGALDTPRTSPTSTRRSHSHTTPYYGHYQHQSGKPLYQSSFVHGPGDEEPGDSEVYSDDESTHDAGHTQHPSQTASHWSYPPNQHPHAQPHPSHQQFAGHVLQSPQPHHNIPHAGIASPNFQPAAPLYDPRMYSGTSPTDLSATASQASAWPPIASYPPPLAIGYSAESSATYLHHSPVASHTSPNVLQSPAAARAVAAHQLAVVPQHHSQQQGTLPNDTVIGYELLAHKLSELKDSHGKERDTVVPAYRKFEQLNHRVLLHLQDEISELEEELRQVDQEIAEASPGAHTGHRHPASRRGDTHFGNDVHRRRIDLLGRVYQKLEQYSKCRLPRPVFMTQCEDS